MRAAGLSDRGLVRENNEDAFIAAGAVAAVADGMGGHQAGAVASRTVLAELTKVLSREPRRPTAGLQKAFSQANAAVLKEGRRSDQSGMGSTLTAAVVKGKRAWIGHVGDSRAYLLRDKKLTQLTEDHSLVADLLKSGSLSPREARVHPRRHVITKAVGSHDTIKPDIFSINLRQGDRLILCTDGLTNHVEPSRLAELAGGVEIKSACRRLVEAAKEGGGSDNITVVIVEPEMAGGRRSRRVGGWTFLAVGSVAAVLAISFILSSTWLNHNFYLISSGEYVAVGRGVPAAIAGYKLGRVERETTIRLDSLPAYYRRRLRPGLVVGDAARLDSLLADLRQLSAGRERI